MLAVAALIAGMVLLKPRVFPVFAIREQRVLRLHVRVVIALHLKSAPAFDEQLLRLLATDLGREEVKGPQVGRALGDSHWLNRLVEHPLLLVSSRLRGLLLALRHQRRWLLDQLALHRGNGLQVSLAVTDFI